MKKFEKLYHSSNLPGPKHPLLEHPHCAVNKDSEDGNHGKGDGFGYATEKIFLTKGLIWKLGEEVKRFLVKRGFLSGPTNPAPSLHLLKISLKVCYMQQNFTSPLFFFEDITDVRIW